MAWRNQESCACVSHCLDTVRVNADRLVQTFTSDSDHSYQSDANYVAAMGSLVDWIDTGNKPSPASIAARCLTLSEAFDPVTSCRFQPEFRPRPLASRVPAR